MNDKMLSALERAIESLPASDLRTLGYMINERLATLHAPGFILAVSSPAPAPAPVFAPAPAAIPDRKTFRVNDIVEFRSRRGFMVRMRVDRVNPVNLAGVSLTGPDARYALADTPWRVNPVFCKLVPHAAPPAPAAAPARAPGLPAFKAPVPAGFGEY